MGDYPSTRLQQRPVQRRPLHDNRVASLLFSSLSPTASDAIGRSAHSCRALIELRLFLTKFHHRAPLVIVKNSCGGDGRGRQSGGRVMASWWTVRGNGKRDFITRTRNDNDRHALIHFNTLFIFRIMCTYVFTCGGECIECMRVLRAHRAHCVH